MAIHLPPEILSRVGLYAQSVQEALRGFAGVMRWVPTHQFHITLKFLGETDPRQLNYLSSSLETACGAASPFSVDLSEASVGPSGGVPKTIWLRIVQEQNALEALAERVDLACKSLGFPAEARRFVPHVTLARIKKPLARESLERGLRSIPPAAFPTFKASAAYLVRSRLHANGADYDTLAEFPFEKP